MKYLFKLSFFVVTVILFAGISAVTAQTVYTTDLLISEPGPDGFQHISPEDAGFDADRLQRLSDMLLFYAGRQRISGAVALVLRNGREVVHEAVGYRDVDSGDIMRKDAIFRIASQTKAIVSVGIMILQEQGKLLISEPAGTYLPEFEETTVAEPLPDGGYEVVPAKRAITIRDLLMHTAGVSYGYGPAADMWQEADMQGWYFAHRDEPVRETVRRMASLPMDEHPGERFVYGYSTDILGAIIEVISGKSLDVFLQDEILGPLGMTDTHFYLPEDKLNRLATVYSATGDRGIQRAPDSGNHISQGHYVSGPRKSFSGGAGMVSTSTDYGRFLQMMLNGGELDGVRILAPSTVKLMTVNHLHDITFRPGRGAGLGFDIVTDIGSRGVPGSAGDFGWGGAYHSTYWVSPEDSLVVVFFTQLIPATGSDIHGKLRTLIYQAMTE